MLNGCDLSSRSRSSVDWRSSVDAEAECVTSDWTAVSCTSLQHEKEADREQQTGRMRLCVDRRMDSNTPMERLKQRGRRPFML